MPDPSLTELLTRRSFSIERTGYSSSEVHGLLRELHSAHHAGQDVGPLIAAANLSEVSFGYDIAEVTAHLRAISDTAGGRTGPPPAPEVPPSEPAPEITPPPSVAAPARTAAETAALVEQILRVRFPMSKRGEGLKVDDVDDFLDRAAQLLSQGSSLESLARAQPLRQEPWAPGYQPEPVEQFIRMLLVIGEGGSDPAAPGQSMALIPSMAPAPAGAQSSGARTVFQVIGLVGVAVVVLWLLFL